MTADDSDLLKEYEDLFTALEWHQIQVDPTLRPVVHSLWKLPDRKDNRWITQNGGHEGHWETNRPRRRVKHAKCQNLLC